MRNGLGPRAMSLGPEKCDREPAVWAGGVSSCLRAFMVLTLGFLCAAPVSADEPRQTVIVVVGAAGADEFAPQFREWADRWKTAAEKGQSRFVAIGLTDETGKADREQLQSALQETAGDAAHPLWLVLIGHGTFDGKTARFNLRGPDVTPADLAVWIKPITRPLAVINCSSCSGPFLPDLSGKDRVVITAARSGHEYNFARFGGHLSQAILDPAADLDKDEQTSLLEAYLTAGTKTAEFYASETRLATEHALLDDNGDKLGSPADFFRGVRPVKAAKDGAALDGSLAARLVLVESTREDHLIEEQRTRRDALERELADLRQQRAKIAEDEYLSRIEPLLVELARLYQ
jgi:hypothetical protein